MILAAGLSPAWQQIVLLDALRPGEVNRSRETLWCASGKVLNVGIALQHLTRDSEALTAAGSPAPTRTLTLAPVGGPAGDEMRRELQTLGVPIHWIETAAGTRVCTTILSASNGETTEIVENARPITAAELDAFREAFREASTRADVVVLAGSFPPGTPTDLFLELMRAASAPIIVDAQGAPLLAALAGRPAVIKPNREELGKTLGRPLANDEDLREALRECHARGAQSIVVSQGAGPVWVSHNHRTTLVAPPQIDVVNPIGSGDCLAAGLAWGLAAGWDLVDAVRLGVAAAADNAGQLLSARLDGWRVARLLEQVTVRTASG